MQPWAPVAERQRVLPPDKGKHMPDPISDALLQAYLDLMNEVTGLYRALEAASVGGLPAVNLPKHVLSGALLGPHHAVVPLAPESHADALRHQP